MYAIPVTIEHGVVHLPPNASLPNDARTAVLVLGSEIHSNEDINSIEFDLAMLRGNPALEFLESEPDIYSVSDVLPENRNPFFEKQ